MKRVCPTNQLLCTSTRCLGGCYFQFVEGAPPAAPTNTAADASIAAAGSHVERVRRQFADLFDQTAKSHLVSLASQLDVATDQLARAHAALRDIWIWIDEADVAGNKIAREHKTRHAQAMREAKEGQRNG